MNRPVKETKDSTWLDDCWNRIGVWGTSGRASCPELEHCIHCRNCSHYSESGRRMLERPASESYLRECTARFGEVERVQEDTGNSVLLFRLGDEWLALNSLLVSEIAGVRTIHSLPHRNNPSIKGLVNIRGELRICLSIGALLKLEHARESHTTDHEIPERMILIARDDQSFVFPVSEVHGIHRFPEHSVEALPATLSHAKNTLTHGIIAWQNHHVGLLNHDLLFYALDRALK